MPQLSLYIDKETLKKLEVAAKLEKVSISKYAVKKLSETLNRKWPENYSNLFGSIQDESFTINKVADFKQDSIREEL